MSFSRIHLTSAEDATFAVRFEGDTAYLTITSPAGESEAEIILSTDKPYALTEQLESVMIQLLKKPVPA